MKTILLNAVVSSLVMGSLVVGAFSCAVHAAPPASKPAAAAPSSAPQVHNVVLVHGAFVDGSGWQRVYSLLKKDGYNVSVVQHTTNSLAEDVAATKRVLAEQDGPAILVGHSYGGAIITEAGNDPKVAKLVYVAAFVPDAGESVGSILKVPPPPGAAVAPILPPKDGFFTLDKTKFAASFAADLDPSIAEFRANSQLPLGVGALEGAITHPAWKDKKSFYVLTTDDKMIPPPAQQAMSKHAGAVVTEVKASHAVYESQPGAVVAVIEAASR